MCSAQCNHCNTKLLTKLLSMSHKSFTSSAMSQNLLDLKCSGNLLTVDEFRS